MLSINTFLLAKIHFVPVFVFIYCNSFFSIKNQFFFVLHSFFIFLLLQLFEFYGRHFSKEIAPSNCIVFLFIE